MIVAADGLGSNGLWQPLGYCWLDFMDLWSEGIMMPLGALFMCIFIGYEYKVDTLAEERAKRQRVQNKEGLRRLLQDRRASGDVPRALRPAADLRHHQ